MSQRTSETGRRKRILNNSLLARLNKNKENNSDIELTINNKSIQSEPWVKLLGIKIDNKLNFNLHRNDLTKTSSGQLNAIIRLKSF